MGRGFEPGGDVALEMKKNSGRGDSPKIKELEEKLWEMQNEILHYLAAFEIPSENLEDALQETMLNAWQHLGQLRDPERIKGWLLAIARNVGKRYVRQGKFQRQTDISLEERMDSISSDDDSEPFDESLFSWFDDLETEQISDLLSCLNQREKKVIILRYAYEHSLKEVAEMIGETYSNTRAISSRAMEKLRSYAKKERDGEKQ